MLILWLLMILWGFFLFVVNLFPTIEVISEISTLNGYASDLGADAAGFNAWIPWATIPIAIGIIAGAVALSLLIRVIRVILRFISMRKVDL